MIMILKERSVLHSMSMKEIVLNALKHYGCIGANMPSFHGAYETEVPKSLQEKAQK